MRYPDYEVFRHPGNKKWFALLADVNPSVLSTSPSRSSEQPFVTILNVKVDPILSGSLRSNPGIHPAYHMNKDKWLSLELAVEETVKMLLELSFDSTKPKGKAATMQSERSE